MTGIKTTIEITLEPLRLPNFVLISDGEARSRSDERPKVSVADLTLEQTNALLNKFCEDFRIKAGHPPSNARHIK